MLFIGDDWAEAHHDIEIEDDSGRLLAGGGCRRGWPGSPRCTSWSRSISTRTASRIRCWSGSRPNAARGCRRCWPPAMWCIAINPMQVARYRERHSTSGAKSDPGDAHLLAEIVRLDRAHHRPVAGDSEIAEHVKVAARAHQTMIWSRVRQVNALRSLLREYYPAALVAFGTDLAGRDALAVLAAAPTPEQGRRLSQARIETLLRKAGRQRNLAATAAKIKTALSSEQLTARPGVVPAYAASARRR